MEKFSWYVCVDRHVYLANRYVYLDAIENVGYFDNIEKVLSSIGLSISDAVMTFFNSGGVQNKDVCIIDRSIDIIIIDIFLFLHQDHRSMWTSTYSTSNIFYQSKN